MANTGSKQPPRPNPTPPCPPPLELPVKGTSLICLPYNSKQRCYPLHLHAVLTAWRVPSPDHLGMAPEDPQKMAEKSPVPYMLQHQSAQMERAWGPHLPHNPAQH